MPQQTTSPLVKVNSRTNRVIRIAEALPGRDFIQGRDRAFIMANDYLHDKAATDGGGDLWLVHGHWYDLSSYMDDHPGGRVFIENSRGHDCTEAFEAHHVRVDAWEQLLKFKVAAPPHAPTTLKPQKFTYNTAWKQIKMRVRKHLVEIGNPTGETPTLTGLTHCAIVAQFLVCAALAARRKSRGLAMLAGLLLVGCWGVGHGQMHRSRLGRWAFLRWAADLTGFSSDEQTVTHAMSHHLFPNTTHDVEITFGLRAGLFFLTSEPAKASWSPLSMACVGAMASLSSLLPRLAVRCAHFDVLRADVVVPVGLVAAMSALAGSARTGVELAALMWATYGFVFLPIGISPHHSHDDVEGRPIKWHEGEQGALEDFALHQVATTADHSLWASDAYLSQVLFAGLNLHTIHHLFPTVDESLHKGILDVLRKENVGGFSDAYEGGPWGGGEQRILDMVRGLFRMVRDRTYEPVPPSQPSSQR